MATAEAQAKGWFFQIAVIKAAGAATYRFIFANETATAAFHQESRATVDSFRTVSAQELAALKALHVHVITAAAAAGAAGAGAATFLAAVVWAGAGIDRARAARRKENGTAALMVELPLIVPNRGWDSNRWRRKAS